MRCPIANPETRTLCLIMHLSMVSREKMPLRLHDNDRWCVARIGAKVVNPLVEKRFICHDPHLDIRMIFSCVISTASVWSCRQSQAEKSSVRNRKT